MKRYFGIFTDHASTKREFETDKYGYDTEPKQELENFPADEDILFACYSYEDYSGRAQVIFQGKDGELYEVQGSHCSCNGLEGQWEPGQVTWAALAMRPREYDYFGHNVSDPEALEQLWALIDFNTQAVVYYA